MLYSPKAVRHLRRDPDLRKIIDAIGPCRMKVGGDVWVGLVESILFQQLSGKAADAILARLLTIYRKQFPKPDDLLRTSVEQFRSAGVSRQKASYLHDLSPRVKDGRLPLHDIGGLSDNAVFERLVAVKGIGRWTADIILMFSLSRPDILPTGDLGIQRGFKILMGKKAYPTENQMIRRAKIWRPYRSIASWYLWQLSDSEPLEKSRHPDDLNVGVPTKASENH